MPHATLVKRWSAVSLAAALGLASEARGQTPNQNLDRVNQDELASFYGRMNVVVGSGARAFGMGGAFLARADDATAASWNPAGLSYLRRTEFSLVGVHNDFLQRVTDQADADNGTAVSLVTRDQLTGTVPDFAGFAYPFRIGDQGGAVQVSYQRSFSFTGERTSKGGTAEFTVDGEGGFDSLSLSSGIELLPQLRIGASVNRWVNGFTQTVSRGATTAAKRTITSRWDVRSGTNVNFGALYTPTPSLNVGAVLKTPFRSRIRLEKKREDPVTPQGGQTGGVPTHVSHVRVRFPLVFGLGVSHRPRNTITLSADFTRTQWSKATISNFFSLAAGNGFDRYNELPFPAVEESANGQVDTSQWRFGGEWILRAGRSEPILIPLRAGFFIDEQPFVYEPLGGGGAIEKKSPTFVGVTMGAGATFGKTIVDVAYSLETGRVPRSAGTAVTRQIQYNRVFVSVMYRFGPRR